MRLRSLLLVPGDRPAEMLEALTSGADALILDLEDLVAVEHKSAAREHVKAFLHRPERPLPVFVRINPVACSISTDDLAAIRHSQVDGIVLPKSEGASSIRDLQRQLWRSSCKRILPIATETPAAVFQLGEYAHVAECLIGLTWCAEDLSSAVGAVSAYSAGGAFTLPYEMVRGLTLFAAHAARIPAIDSAFTDVRDKSGLAIYAARAAHDGFSGMLAIHPNQVAVINKAFTPTAEIVAGPDCVNAKLLSTGAV